MRSRPNPFFRLLHPDYHETFDAYVPQLSDFHDIVAARLPEGWKISRQGIWFHCSSSANVLPRQGWKIHLSATLATARQVLACAISVVFRRQDSNFKFALDFPTLQLINGKNWPRGGSGKFITVYPADDACFLALIEELHKSTKGQRGPYILSDQRYPESGVVFFRYGGVRSDEKLTVRGERVPHITSPDGEAVPDQRLPYPVLPNWVGPVLLAEEPRVDAADERGVKNGRFKIESVFSFSTAGGVYLAHDKETGKRVVVKEARPYVNGNAAGGDAIDLLRKEYRLLNVLSWAGIAPKPIDLFQDWEHWFLVEEHIEGIPLSLYSAEKNILLRTRAEHADYQQWYRGFRELVLSLIRIVDVLHAHDIVFGDLSPNNLLVLPGSSELKLIDFEGAYQENVDPAASLYTPGFTSPRRLKGMHGSFEDDCYSLAAVIFSTLYPVNGLFHFQPEAKKTMLDSIRRDAHLPPAVADALAALLSGNPEQLCDTSALAHALQENTDCANGANPIEPSEAECRAALDGIVIHMLETANYKRQDRLFPADARIFSTNPLSLAYGASGVAHTLHRVTGECPRPILDWILDHSITQQYYAPGLYIGSSGIAWCLLEMGQIDSARQIFRQTINHPLLLKACDLYYGLAGWGMTCLRFHMETGEEEYLEQAEIAGKHLLRFSTKDHRGRSWPSEDLPLGIGHGSSGVALFLLYLHLATGEEKFLDAGREALDFDLSYAVDTVDKGISWPCDASAPSTLYPYWRFGSAGIGCVVLRYYRVLQDPQYLSLLEKIFIDTDRKYAVFPGRLVGLAGLGEFLLDMHQFTDEPKYLESARTVSQGILNFQVRRTGIAFPGDMLARLCCDLGTGSAGIALFLNRLLNRQPSDFMLDALFNHARNPLLAQHSTRAAAVLTI